MLYFIHMCCVYFAIFMKQRKGGKRGTQNSRIIRESNVIPERMTRFQRKQDKPHLRLIRAKPWQEN